MKKTFQIDGGEFLRHLTFWTNKTDDECIVLATNEYGVDAEQALANILERDFCTSISNEAVKLLMESINNKEQS